MRFRKLRIAWSVIWGMIEVLLIALWVRSYWKIDGFSGDCGDHYYQTAIIGGELYFARHVPNGSGQQPRRIFPNRFTGSDTESTINNVKQIRRMLGVGWSRFGVFFDYGWQASVSLWWPTLISIALAAVPCIRCRFSLRTLLIAMTLIAAALGLAIYTVKK
ncbi:MAG TPA: hypothetical protein VHU84_17870 [Lacipirellulaceae bacterium]|jgi:hypothetical protein|nr:hypothetical protein [Lacipirellulaceae bacterium]